MSSETNVAEDSEAPESGWENVHTVSDYWDAPLTGVADYRGQPHHYERIFDETSDEWSNTFILIPLDNETFQLLLEDWEIWSRWSRAQRSGKVRLDSHPALPEDRGRFEEITEIITRKLAGHPEQRKKVAGRFERMTPSGPQSEEKWRVKWFRVADDS
jgi:hypothetical protein